MAIFFRGFSGAFAVAWIIKYQNTQAEEFVPSFDALESKAEISAITMAI